jgi:hypothetical protein
LETSFLPLREFTSLADAQHQHDSWAEEVAWRRHHRRVRAGRPPWPSGGVRHRPRVGAAAWGAKRAGTLEAELERLGRIPLLIVDEVGYIPFDPQAAALFFALVSSRYERRSMIVSSNKTFSGWAEIFGDPVAVAAMVDRLVHHAEVIVLKGESYRLKGKRKEVMGSGDGALGAQFSTGDSCSVFDRR